METPNNSDPQNMQLDKVILALEDSLHDFDDVHKTSARCNLAGMGKAIKERGFKGLFTHGDEDKKSDEQGVTWSEVQENDFYKTDGSESAFMDYTRDRYLGGSIENTRFEFHKTGQQNISTLEDLRKELLEQKGHSKDGKEVWEVKDDYLGTASGIKEVKKLFQESVASKLQITKDGTVPEFKKFGIIYDQGGFKGMIEALTNNYVDDAVDITTIHARSQAHGSVPSNSVLMNPDDVAFYNINPICGLWDEAGKVLTNRIDVSININITVNLEAAVVDIMHTRGIRFNLQSDLVQLAIASRDDASTMRDIMDNYVEIFNDGENAGARNANILPVYLLIKSYYNFGVEKLCKAYTAYKKEVYGSATTKCKQKGLPVTYDNLQKHKKQENEGKGVDAALDVLTDGKAKGKEEDSHFKKNLDQQMKTLVGSSTMPWFEMEHLNFLNVKRSADYGQVYFVKKMNELVSTPGAELSMRAYNFYKNTKKLHHISAVTRYGALPKLKIDRWVLFTGDRLCYCRAVLEGVPCIFFNGDDKCFEVFNGEYKSKGTTSSTPVEQQQYIADSEGTTGTSLVETMDAVTATIPTEQQKLANFAMANMRSENFYDDLKNEHIATKIAKYDDLLLQFMKSVVVLEGSPPHTDEQEQGHEDALEPIKESETIAKLFDENGNIDDASFLTKRGISSEALTKGQKMYDFVFEKDIDARTAKSLAGRTTGTLRDCIHDYIAISSKARKGALLRKYEKVICDGIDVATMELKLIHTIITQNTCKYPPECVLDDSEQETNGANVTAKTISEQEPATDDETMVPAQGQEEAAPNPENSTDQQMETSSQNTSCTLLIKGMPIKTEPLQKPNIYSIFMGLISRFFRWGKNNNNVNQDQEPRQQEGGTHEEELFDLSDFLMNFRPYVISHVSIADIVPIQQAINIVSCAVEDSSTLADKIKNRILFYFGVLYTIDSSMYDIYEYQKLSVLMSIQRAVWDVLVEALLTAKDEESKDIRSEFLVWCFNEFDNEFYDRIITQVGLGSTKTKTNASDEGYKKIVKKKLIATVVATIGEETTTGDIEAAAKAINEAEAVIKDNAKVEAANASNEADAVIEDDADKAGINAVAEAKSISAEAPIGQEVARAQVQIEPEPRLSTVHPLMSMCKLHVLETNGYLKPGQIKKGNIEKVSSNVKRRAAILLNAYRALGAGSSSEPRRFLQRFVTIEDMEIDVYPVDPTAFTTRMITANTNEGGLGGGGTIRRYTMRDYFEKYYPQYIQIYYDR